MEGLVSLLPLLLIIVVFYFILIRPQRNQQKQRAQLQRSLTPGERVMTNAGLYATVVTVDDDSVVLEIAPGVECRYVKAAVAQRMDAVGNEAIGKSDDTPPDSSEPEKPST